MCCATEQRFTFTHIKNCHSIGISNQMHMDSDATVRNQAEMRPRILGVGIGESLPVISSIVILLSDMVPILI